MLDLTLGALLVGLGIRGWMRGLIREVISLAVLVIGTIAAFRLSTPVGAIFADMSGASPDAARWAAGVAIFLTVAIGAALASRILHLGMRVLPGVSTLNRAAGAGLSLIALTLVVTLAVSLATVTEMPDSIEQQLDESAVAATLTDADGIPQRILGVLSGDRVMEMSLRIRELTGSEQAIAKPDRPIEFPAADPDELNRLPAAEAVVFELRNRERVAADVDPLLRSPGLDQVALDHTLAGYARGGLAIVEDGELRSILNVTGFPTTAAAMVAALAASPEAAHAALADTEAVLRRGFTKTGVAVVQGPVGLLVIEILAE